MERAVPVEERSTKNDHRSASHYLLQLCPGAGGNYRVEFTNFGLLELDGIPAADPRIAGAVASLAPVMAAIPAIVVDAKGAAVGIEGFDEAFNALAKSLPEAKVEEMRQLFASEKWRRILEEGCYDRWRTWVENWLAYDPRLGPNLEIVTNMGGAPQTHQLSFVGWSGTSARFSLETNFSREQLLSFFESLTDAASGKKFDEQTLQSASLVVKTQVESDWPTIRPHSARREKTFSMTADGQRRQRSEVQEFRFDWDNTEPAVCGK